MAELIDAVPVQDVETFTFYLAYGVENPEERPTWQIISWNGEEWRTRCGVLFYPFHWKPLPDDPTPETFADFGKPAGKWLHADDTPDAAA
jgi:hypothetical protein